MRGSACFVTIARAVVATTIPILLVATPLYLFVRPGFAHYQYARRGFPSSDRFLPAERARLSDAILNTLRGRESVEELAAERTDDGEIAMREEEVQHLVDVKRVMDGFFISHAIAAALAIGAALALWHTGRRGVLAAALRQGVGITGGLMVMILLASFLDFDLFFTRFHQIFFRAESWIFYVEDTLIQLYPLPFWIDTVFKFTLCILLEAGVVYGLSVAAVRLKERTGG